MPLNGTLRQEYVKFKVSYSWKRSHKARLQSYFAFIYRNIIRINILKDESRSCRIKGVKFSWNKRIVWKQQGQKCLKINQEQSREKNGSTNLRNIRCTAALKHLMAEAEQVFFFFKSKFEVKVLSSTSHSWNILEFVITTEGGERETRPIVLQF